MWRKGNFEKTTIGTNLEQIGQGAQCLNLYD